MLQSYLTPSLLIFLSSLPLVCAALGRSFTLDSTMDNIKFEKWIIHSSSEESILQCSRKCDKYIDCLSFQFSSQTGHCSLFDTIFLFPSAGVQDPGWQYYTFSNRRCKPGFIDGRSRDLCFKFTGFHDIDNAQTLCAGLQSSIIAITSDDENNLLWKLADTLTNESLLRVPYYYPYVQGQFDTSDLIWKLDDGTPLTYTNWDSKQPSRQDIKRCIQLVEKKWETTYTHKIRPIICSYRL